MKISRNNYKEEILINNSKYFFSPKELLVKAYYNVRYYKFSEEMKKHKYICHVILLDAVKVSNYKQVMEIQRYAIKKYFEKNKNIYNIHRNESVFHTIMEFKKGIRFIPDISMHKYTLENKLKMQDELGIKFAQMILITPGFPARLITTIPIISKYLKEDRDFAIASNFSDALQKLDTLNELPPEHIEGL